MQKEKKNETCKTCQNCGISVETMILHTTMRVVVTLLHDITPDK